MTLADPFTHQVKRWHEWPGDETAVFSVPDERFIYEPIEEDSNYYIPVAWAPTEIPFTPEEPPVPTAVYRAFDESDCLLYVGVSGTPEKRWCQHAADKPWWSSVARLTIDWRDSRAEALAVEAAAIRDEAPAHNVLHNGTRKSVAWRKRNGRTVITRPAAEPAAATADQ